MIDIKAFKKQILTEVGLLVKRDGFKSKISEQKFSLLKPFGTWIIHLSFIPHRKMDLDVKASVAIRIDAVETLVNEDRPELSEGDSAKTATAGGELGNLQGAGPKRWTIALFNDARPVASSIYSEILSIGWPFLERYSNMENLLNLLSSLDPKDWGRSNGSLPRCKRAMALAYLLGRVDYIDATLMRCREVLSQEDSAVHQHFSAFFERLQAKMESGDLPNLGL